MNWEAIGVIAEITAAVAVIISLVYLGIQVKHGAAQSVANASSQSWTEFNRMQEAMIANPNIAELYGKLNTAAELNDAEDALLEMLSRRYIVHWYDVQSGHDRKLLDNLVYDAHCEDVKRMIKRYPLIHRKFKDVLVDYSSSPNLRILDPIFENDFEPQ